MTEQQDTQETSRQYDRTTGEKVTELQDSGMTDTRHVLEYGLSRGDAMVISQTPLDKRSARATWLKDT
jgi:hypothetical protein